jgi:hypothetical protein
LIVVPVRLLSRSHAAQESTQSTHHIRKSKKDESRRVATTTTTTTECNPHTSQDSAEKANAFEQK